MARPRMSRRTPVAIRYGGGVVHEVPGRIYRGLALIAPSELTEYGRPVPIRQDISDPRWDVTHVESGLGLGSIWAPLREAWVEMRSIADIVDWERTSAEIEVDAECKRICAYLRDINREDHT